MKTKLDETVKELARNAFDNGEKELAFVLLMWHVHVNMDAKEWFADAVAKIPTGGGGFDRHTFTDHVFNNNH